MPEAMASSGERGRTSRPATRTDPASRAASPNSTRASSVRPAPTSPARPTISPRLTVRLTSLTPASRDDRPSTSSTGTPMATSRFGKTEATSRPTISLISAAASTAAMAWVPTVRPSRSTVTRSASRGSSSRRCEM